LSWLRLLNRVAGSQGALSIVDQAAVSAGNFGTGVVLARALDQSSFAVYVLAAAVSFFILQVQYGVLMHPLTVNGAALDDNGFRQFVTANAWLQTAFTAATGVVLVMLIGVWEPLRPVAAPLIVLSILWQIQEFCRRVLYARAAIGSALLNNIVNYDLQVVVLIAAAILVPLDLGSALWIAAATSLIATLLGVWQIRRYLSGRTANLRATAESNFRIGRWTAASALLVAAGHQTTPVLVAALDGVAAAAVVGVIFQLLGPVNLLGRPLQNYFTPLAIRALANDGARGLDAVLKRAILITGPGFILYTVIVAAFPVPFLWLAYGDKYLAYADALRIFAIDQMLAFPLSVVFVELNARRMQKHMMWGIVAFTVVLYTLGAFAIVHFGIAGLGWTLVIATAGQVALYVMWIARARQAHGLVRP
jgi:O-antigen/teichoic acid export membrane protein